MVLAGVFVTLATLLTSIDTAAFDKRFYRYQYQKLGTAQRIGISEEDLMRATDVLLDYCAGKRDDLSLVVERDGVRMQMFTDETEVAHMVDVQALFLLMISVRNGLAIASMLCLVAAFALRLPLADAMKKLMWGLGIGLLIPILCGVLAVVDFNLSLIHISLPSHRRQRAIAPRKSRAAHTKKAGCALRPPPRCPFVLPQCAWPAPLPKASQSAR